MAKVRARECRPFIDAVVEKADEMTVPDGDRRRQRNMSLDDARADG